MSADIDAIVGAAVDPDAEVLETQLTLYFGATLAVNTNAQGFSDWIKPSASFSKKWKGTPSGEQLVLAIEHTQENILSPMLGDIIKLCQERMAQARRGG